MTTARLIIVTGSLTAASVASAQTFSYAQNFDGFAPNSTVDTLPAVAGLDLAIRPAFFGPLFDNNGDPIPGSNAWRPDALSPLLTVENPAGYGRGNAPSGTLALNALFQPTLILFSSPVDLASFSVTLDNDTFGDNGFLPGNRDISLQFLDANGGLIALVPINQTIPGFLAVASNISGVSSVYIPAGAFYDDLTAVGTVVPAPTMTGLLAIAGLAAGRRKR